MVSSLLAALLGCAPSSPAHADAPLAWPTDNPVELGRVRWMRGYAAAQERAAREGLPLVVLFDEVPGCSTVRNYGQTTLSDPWVVDALETLFVPVVVYNNVGGDDRRVLDAFGEPSWNNPVVRFLDATGQELAPRLTGDWSRGALLQRLVTTLGAAEQPVPAWLDLIAREDRAPRDTRTYAMGCFWSGEAHLGSHDAVLSTRTGFASGREVVEVAWDKKRTSAEALDTFARARGAHPVGTKASLRPSPADDRYQLKGTRWARVPLSPGQASRVNADVGARRDPSRWLSPRQQALVAQPDAPYADAFRKAAAAFP